MEPSSYFKSTCAHCGGHIEAPTEGAGMWIRCPHCAEKTQLVAPPPKLDAQPVARRSADNNSSDYRLAIIIGVSLLLVAAVGAALWRVRAEALKRKPPIRATVTTPAAASPTPKPVPQPEPYLWNGLKPGPITIEKSAKSRLIYAIGTIRNETDKQRFGVKVALDVLDANGEKIGSAVDQTQFIDAHQDWNYKALVTSAKATTAKVTAITEN